MLCNATILSFCSESMCNYLHNTMDYLNSIRSRNSHNRALPGAMPL